MYAMARVGHRHPLLRFKLAINVQEGQDRHESAVQQHGYG